MIAVKDGLFIWKVLQSILAVKDGLRRRNLSNDVSCSLCGEMVDTIDHLSLGYPFAKTLWCKSRLGISAGNGERGSVAQWFNCWLADKSSESIICQYVCILWEIWCARNRTLHDLAVPTFERCIANIDSNISALMKSRDATKGGDVRSAVHDGAHNASFSFGQHGDLAQLVKVVVDGAWRKENFQGVAAWCMRDSNAQSCANGFTHVYAMSSTGVEALVILQALRWAKMKEFKEVTLLTDSLEVVRALSNVNCANVSIRNVILDILDVVLSFDYVNVTRPPAKMLRMLTILHGVAFVITIS